MPVAVAAASAERLPELRPVPSQQQQPAAPSQPPPPSSSQQLKPDALEQLSREAMVDLAPRTQGADGMPAPPPLLLHLSASGGSTILRPLALLALQSCEGCTRTVQFFIRGPLLVQNLGSPIAPFINVVALLDKPLAILQLESERLPAGVRNRTREQRQPIHARHLWRCLL